MNIQTQLEDYHNLTTWLYFRGNEPQKSRRVQLKMPAAVVEMLDKKFPKVNRSRLLTQAAIELLIRKTRSDRPDLEQWLASEQDDLDEMWSYLKFRDKKFPSSRRGGIEALPAGGDCLRPSECGRSPIYADCAVNQRQNY